MTGMADTLSGMTHTCATIIEVSRVTAFATTVVATLAVHRTGSLILQGAQERAGVPPLSPPGPLVLEPAGWLSAGLLRIWRGTAPQVIAARENATATKPRSALCGPVLNSRNVVYNWRQIPH